MIKTGDITIAYKEYGSSRTGVPLVMIMGYGVTMDLWPPAVLESFASHHRVLIFDNRGMGYTSASDKDFSIELFTDDTVGFMDALGIGRAHILGWSMGTFIAQELALRHPERVESLVLFAGYCGGQEAVRADEKIWRMLFDLSGTIPERMQRMLTLLFPPRWLTDHPEPSLYMPSFTEPIKDESLLRQSQAINLWQGTFSRLPAMTQPTLIITGTDDAVVPAANALILGERIPGASVVQIRGGGHGVIYQAPEQFGDYVLTFLHHCQ
jgi:pimeloyl-ACP methyl ester carboxylesterase